MYFAPPQRLSPVEQIVNAAAVALLLSANPISGAAAFDGAVAVLPARRARRVHSRQISMSSAGGGARQSPQSELQPPSLGSVTISLSLSSGGLTRRWPRARLRRQSSSATRTAFLISLHSGYPIAGSR